MPNNQEVTLTAAQLSSLVNALVNDPEMVGELDDHEYHQAFVGDLVSLIAKHRPLSLLECSVTEILANIRATTSIFADQDFTSEAAQLVADHCGGEYQPSPESQMNEMTGLVFSIKANDCIPDEHDIMSSNAWSFADKEKPEFSMGVRVVPGQELTSPQM